LAVFSDAYLYTFEGFADRIQRMIGIRRRGNDGRAFSCTISLHDAEAHVFPTLGECGRYICTAADKNAEVPSKAFMHRSRDEATPAKRQNCFDSEKLFELCLSVMS